MAVITSSGPRLYTVDGQHFIHVPKERARPLQLHLASNGVESLQNTPSWLPCARLDLKGDVDPIAVQEILDDWEHYNA